MSPSHPWGFLCVEIQAKVQSDVNRVAGVKLSNEWSINQFKCYYPHFSYDCRISEIDLNKSI